MRLVETQESAGFNMVFVHIPTESREFYRIARVNQSLLWAHVEGHVQETRDLMRASQPHWICALAAVSWLGSCELWADSMRCGRKVVRSGDSPATLLEHCGEPRYRGRSYAEIQTGDGKRNVRVEQWHYKLGERSLERIVLIYRGEIVAVETGSR